MSTFDYDISYDRFLKVLSQLAAVTGAENEAATRLRAIDVMLFDVLDWQREEVDPESYCRAQGYADYVCKIEGRVVLVIEAKRAGTTFVLRTEKLDNRPYSFGFLAQESKEAADALQQVIGYAATIGARYVAITNGSQWVLAMTYVESRELDERLVYVFESPEAIKSKFRMFCDCFAKAQMGTGRVDADLLGIVQKPPPPKLSSRIPGYPLAGTRNVFRNELSLILDYVWQVMSQDEGSKEFIHNCYVNPQSHEDAIALVRELLTKRHSEDAILVESEVVGIDSLLQRLAQLPTARPFVILGEIGRGKTSFLKYLRHEGAADLLANYIQIDINFLDRPDEPGQVPKYIYDELENQLLANYGIDVREDRFVRGVLHGELMRLRRTPEGQAYQGNPEKFREYELGEIQRLLADRHTYFIRVFHHLKKGRKHSLALFLDNLDRRDPALQEEAFLKASALARDWACLVFVSLRPDTFYRSREKGVLDTIAPLTFTVSHPDLSLVLKRRFAYAKEIAEGKRLCRTVLPDGSGGKVGLELPKVAAIFGSCEFAAWKRHGMIPLLEAASNGNIRRMLDFARATLCSGHLDTAKIVKAIEKDGRYHIPDYEGIKALLYGEYLHFDPSKSPFVNLFDLIHADAREHFACMAILQYLDRTPFDGPTNGYVGRISLAAYLNSVGICSQALENCLSRLEQKQLIRRLIPDTDTPHEKTQFRITALGRFHLFNLIPSFQYLDAVTVDTPVLDESTRKQITDTTLTSERVKRTTAFLAYLDKAVESMTDQGVRDQWREISLMAWESIRQVKL